MLAMMCCILASLAIAGCRDAQDPPFIRAGRIYPEEMRLTFSGGFSPSMIEHPDAGPWFAGGERFGKALFDPASRDGALRVADDGLIIQPMRIGGVWKSGQVQSVDNSGHGFSQTGGYFVMRAELPTGRRSWPAFWLRPAYYRQTPNAAIAEVDAVETYGHRPFLMDSTLHYWPARDQPGAPLRPHSWQSRKSIHPLMTRGLHDYGVYIDNRWTIFFYDNREVGRVRSIPEERTPMYMIIDDALTEGPDAPDTPPGRMTVRYARAYQ
jgi:hypothetical protein